MDHRFDRLAKSVGGAVTRRQALWRLGGGLIAAVLASVGLGAAQDDPLAKCCAFACLNLNPPPRGEELAICITTCLDEGLVGGSPVVCPLP